MSRLLLYASDVFCLALNQFILLAMHQLSGALGEKKNKNKYNQVCTSVQAHVQDFQKKRIKGHSKAEIDRFEFKCCNDTHQRAQFNI